MNTMDQPLNPAELQADALVQQIHQQVAAQQRAILDEARREAEEVARRAQDKARRQAQRASEELRAQSRRRLRQLQAELETAGRRQASAQAQQALALAWPQLADALQRRWQDSTAREHWVAAQLALARRRLAPSGWVVHHPGVASEAEIRALQAALQAAGMAGATLRADPQLSAGLVIEADGARLDSSPPALLADRALVEAALLAALATGGPTP